MKKLAPTPKTLAQQLQEVQIQRELLEEKEVKLRTKLLANLQEQGVKGVKLADGTSYSVAERHTLKIAPGEEQAAQLWAEDNYCMRVDTAKAMAILRRSLKKIPACFTVGSTKYLVIKKP